MNTKRLIAAFATIVAVSALAQDGAPLFHEPDKLGVNYLHARDQAAEIINRHGALRVLRSRKVSSIETFTFFEDEGAESVRAKCSGYFGPRRNQVLATRDILDGSIAISVKQAQQEYRLLSLDSDGYALLYEVDPRSVPREQGNDEIIVPSGSATTE